MVSSNSDEKHVAAFVDSLDETFYVETEAYISMDVDGEMITRSEELDLTGESTNGIDIY